MSTVPPEPGPPGPPFTAWQRLGLQPDTGLYVGKDDILFIRHKALSTLVLTLRVRWQRPEDGEIIPQQFDFAVAAAAGPVIALAGLGEGFLLSAELTTATLSIRRGACYAEVSLARSGGLTTDRSLKLMSGYVQTGQSLGFPVGDVEDPLDGQGLITSFVIANPAPGAEVLFTVGTTQRSRIMGLRFPLVTDATVPVRRVHLQVRDQAGNVLMDLAAADTQAASLTRNYNCEPDIFQRAAQDNEIYIPIPPDLRLLQGSTIRTVTTALAAGDDFGIPVIFLESWLEE